MVRYYCSVFILYGLTIFYQHSCDITYKLSPQNEDFNQSDSGGNLKTEDIKFQPLCPLLQTRIQQEFCLPHFLVPDNVTQGVHRLYIARRGRLGNAMFEFASAYSIAKATGRLLVLDSYFTADFLALFPNVRSKFLLQSLPKESHGVHTIHDFHFGRVTSWYITHLPNIDLVLLGHYQSWKYFDEFDSDIRHFFEIDSKYAERAKSVIDHKKADAVEMYLNLYCWRYGHCDLTRDKEHSQWTSIKNNTKARDIKIKAPITIRNITVIGVHVRRGDLITDHQQKAYGRTVAPLSFIFKAMEHFRKQFPHPIFVVASDDIEWCVEHFRLPDVSFLWGQSAFEDFSVLASCDHMIVSVGTFGWWAGWLTRGQVIYYADMIKPYSDLWEFYRPEDSFPPSWIPMR